VDKSCHRGELGGKCCEVTTNHMPFLQCEAKLGRESLGGAHHAVRSDEEVQSILKI
jgi:hypothetical protein